MKSLAKTAYKDRRAFDNAFAKLASLEQQRNEKNATLQAEIQHLQSIHQPEIDKLNETITSLSEALANYAEQHREELTNNGKNKTLKLPYGVIKWRKQPDSVQISGNLNEIISELKKRRLSRFIRTKTEINKQAILAEAQTFIKQPIKGIEFISGKEVLTIQAGGNA